MNSNSITKQPTLNFNKTMDINCQLPPIRHPINFSIHSPSFKKKILFCVDISDTLLCFN